MGHKRKIISGTGFFLAVFVLCLLISKIMGVEKAYGKGVFENICTDDLNILKEVATKKVYQNVQLSKLSNADKNQIVLINDISINTYLGSSCLLPEEVNVKYRGGNIQKEKVIWDEKTVDTSKTGIYIIEGRVKGYREKVKCVITVKSLEDIINELVILPDHSYDKTECDRIIGRISRIHPGILNGLLNKGIHIKLINTPITYLPEYAYLKGMVPRGWENTNKTWDDVPGVNGNPVAIRIGYSEPGKGHGAINLELHEIGHTIDSYVFNSVSGTKKFSIIWEREANNLFGDNNYFLKYCNEYFAEAFAMYYLDNEYKYELSYKAPLTFKFIENLEMTVN